MEKDIEKDFEKDMGKDSNTEKMEKDWKYMGMNYNFQYN